MASKPARKSSVVAAYRPPRPRTPVAKLQESLRRLESLNGAAHPDMSYEERMNNVRLPKEIEAAASKISKHVEAVVAEAQKVVKGKK